MCKLLLGNLLGAKIRIYADIRKYRGHFVAGLFSTVIGNHPVCCLLM